MVEGSLRAVDVEEDLRSYAKKRMLEKEEPILHSTLRCNRRSTPHHNLEVIREVLRRGFIMLGVSITPDVVHVYLQLSEEEFSSLTLKVIKLVGTKPLTKDASSSKVFHMSPYPVKNMPYKPIKIMA